MEPDNGHGGWSVDAARRIEDSERAFFAGVYANHAYHPTGWRLRLERDARMLLTSAPGQQLGRVLSIGCGDGQFELLLAPHSHSVLGVDLSPDAIEAARRNQARGPHENVEFRCASFADLAPTDRFDTIICLAFLHHLPVDTVAPFLATVRALLTPGGTFFAQEPNRKAFLRYVGRLVLGARYDQYHSPDERELDPVEVDDALRNAGFEKVEIRYNDVTLIPGMYFFKSGPDLMFHAFALIDRLWCATPLARWASGFYVQTEKTK